jgi:hypothetical protein
MAFAPISSSTSLVLGLRGNNGFLWFFEPENREKLVLHTGSTQLACV